MSALIHNKKKRLLLYAVNAVLWLLFLPKNVFGKSVKFKSLPAKKILLVRLDYIGDVVMTSPSFSFIRHRFPNAKITLLTNPSAKVLFSKDPRIDEIDTFNWPWGHLRANNRFSFSLFKELFHLVFRLRRKKFDLMVDFRGDMRFALLFGFFTGAKVLVGNSRSGNKFMLDYASEYDASKHELERTLDVLACFGEIPIVSHPEIFLSDEAKLLATKHFEELLGTSSLKKLAMIAPFSSKDIKSWPLPYFEAVIKHLLTLDYKVVIVGTREDQENSASLASAFPSKVYSLAGKTSLNELACMTLISTLVVGVDTGVLHIASCFDTPIIAIFGPTRSCEYRPYSKFSIVVDSGECKCDQLTHAKCDSQVNGYARCMFELGPQAVIRAIQSI
ncbi:MAG: glycosyltransferase family 9 protein [Imperialibacter sp.]|uniref:glycosyltransferase family 9 protein n=1 Tax=Imperialibacter sp. TaxID=2038411 RepID=UPI0032EBF5A0